MPTKAGITENTEQYMQNLSFDKEFDVPVVEILGHDNTNSVLRRIQVDANGYVKVST